MPAMALFEKMYRSKPAQNLTIGGNFLPNTKTIVAETIIVKKLVDVAAMDTFVFGFPRPTMVLGDILLRKSPPFLNAHDEDDLEDEDEFDEDEFEDDDYDEDEEDDDDDTEDDYDEEDLDNLEEFDAEDEDLDEEDDDEEDEDEEDDIEFEDFDDEDFDDFEDEDDDF